MHTIKVSIVYALSTQQWLQDRQVKRGTSAADLIELSGFLDQIESLKGQQLADLSIGIYGQKVAHDTLLEDADRVEIYRPLSADPKEVRRQLALLGKTMGNK